MDQCNAILLYSSNLGYFQVIPHPIFINIFQYLKSEKRNCVISSIRLTCKTFYQYASHIFLQNVPIQHLQFFLEKLNNTKTILPINLYIFQSKKKELVYYDTPNNIGLIKSMPIKKLILNIEKSESSQILKILPDSIITLGFRDISKTTLQFLPKSLKKIYLLKSLADMSIREMNELMYASSSYHINFYSGDFFLKKMKDHFFTPLIYFTRCDNIEILKVLLDNVNVEQTTLYSSSTILHIACESILVDVVELILKYKPNVNKTDDNGNTPLMFSLYSDLRIAELLLEYGADPNIPNKKKETPLYIACTKGYLPIVELLLRFGANPNQPSVDNEKPLFTACIRNEINIIKLLIQYGADLKQCPNLLHIASWKGRIDIILFLINNGFDVNRMNKKGYTPLYGAFISKNVDAMQLLLLHGANPNLTPNGKKSILEQAKELKEYGFVELITKFCLLNKLK
jgi:ankyrin repeat protein